VGLVADIIYSFTSFELSFVNRSSLLGGYGYPPGDDEPLTKDNSKLVNE
jgi:hypothetical protein